MQEVEEAMEEAATVEAAAVVVEVEEATEAAATVVVVVEMEEATEAAATMVVKEKRKKKEEVVKQQIDVVEGERDIEMDLEDLGVQIWFLAFRLYRFFPSNSTCESDASQ